VIKAARDVASYQVWDLSASMRDARFSVVIPVFNSEAIVGTTIDRTVTFLRGTGVRFEVICVNDGSRDASWRALEAKATEYPEVVAVDLLRNYGQHNAVMCGLRQSVGDWVITLDDDLQNPPEEMIHLIRQADEGAHDVVFGRFHNQQASSTRRIGTRLIGMINRRIFNQPSGLAVTNFRLLRRDVVDRICDDRSASPYITGLTLLYSRSPGNATVEHAPRAEGSSNYSAMRIAKLVLTILFSYSAFPLRLFAMVGFLVALIAFVIGTVYLILGMTGQTQVEGWTSLIVLTAFLNGMTIAMVSMVGEYLVRTLNQTSARQPYHISRVVGTDD
jgi:glycosyltransferase involved in cell wall biosynthesis